MRDRRAYLREYQLKWVKQRREQWISENGPCQHCGSTEDLEVDHIDPQLKSMPPAAIWTRRLEVRLAELAKCQVLCRDCHKRKTVAQLRRDHPHGTRGRYGKGCRCDLCRSANTAEAREYRHRIRQQLEFHSRGGRVKE